METDPYYLKYMRYKEKYLQLKEYADSQEGGDIVKMSGQCLIAFASKESDMLNLINKRLARINREVKQNLKQEYDKQYVAYQTAKLKEKVPPPSAKIKLDFDGIWKGREKKEEERIRRTAMKDADLYTNITELYNDMNRSAFIFKLGSKEGHQIIVVEENKNEDDLKKLLEKMVKDQAAIEKKIKQSVASFTADNKKILDDVHKQMQSIYGKSANDQLSMMNEVSTIIKNLQKNTDDTINEANDNLKLIIDKITESIDEIKTTKKDTFPRSDLNMIKLTSSSASIKTGGPSLISAINTIIASKVPSDHTFVIDSLVEVDIRGKIIYLNHFTNSKAQQQDDDE